MKVRWHNLQLSLYFIGIFQPKCKKTIGRFEYPELNALLTPSDARSSCDADLHCAGFTYRGTKGATQKFNVKFFRFISREAFK